MGAAITPTDLGVTHIELVAGMETEDVFPSAHNSLESSVGSSAAVLALDLRALSETSIYLSQTVGIGWGSPTKWVVIADSVSLPHSCGLVLFAGLAAAAASGRMGILVKLNDSPIFKSSDLDSILSSYSVTFCPVIGKRFCLDGMCVVFRRLAISQSVVSSKSSSLSTSLS